MKPSGRVATLVAQLTDADRQVAFDAATELGEIGPEAIAAVPALVELATFNEKGSYRIHPTLAAGEALGKINRGAAVPHLIGRLKERERRYWAARILGDFGQDAKPAIHALVDALRAVTDAQTDDERSASAQAAAALAKINPHGLSALVGEMGHNHVEVRKLAVWATPRGTDGKPAVNELALRLSDDDAAVRTLSAKALADIGPDASDALPFVKLALDRERDPTVLFALRHAANRIKSDSGDNR